MTSWLARRASWVRLLLAVVSGLLTALGFQPTGWWPLTILGVAGFSLAIAAGTKLWGALGLGYGFGLGFLFIGVGWMQVIFLQAMIALVVIEAVFFAALGLLLRVAMRVPWWPLLGAACWTIIEATYARFPFGGFGWMRLGFSVADSPLAWGYPLYGVAVVGFLTALAGQLLAWVAEGPLRQRWLIAAGSVAAIVMVSAGGLAVTAGAASGSVNAGWVQGGAPGGGVFGLGPARTITTNQVRETAKLTAAVDAGTLPHPDFIVWPENSTDLDVFSDPQTAALVQSALRTAGVPILVGAVLDGPGSDERETASLWWDPTTGIGERYVKRGIVPFGEWVPLRSLLLPLIPELAYVGAQSVPGTQPGVIHGSLPDQRSLDLGVVVCYDLAFDQFVADTVTHGAQVVVVQSSNAMYQGTGQIEQQFAITRVRAMELRREILVVTTSGISGLIEPDGSVSFRTGDYQSASGVATLPLRTGLTPAAQWGGWFELTVVVAGLLGLVASLRWGRMAKAKSDAGDKHD